MATAWTISAKSSVNLSTEWDEVSERWEDYSPKFATTWALNDWTILQSSKAQAATES
jgi:hypothetical protein